MDHTKRFLLTSDECELLLHLEETGSLQAVAEQMARDHSVLSRNLKRMAEKLPVLEKNAGRWVLTEMGKRFNDASRSMISMQRSYAQTRQSLRIGTNREFAARVLGPDLSNLNKLLGNVQLSVNAFERGIEESLLSGQIDVGFDCDRPNSPDIAYKLILNEPIIAVCSPEFKKANKKKLASEGYLRLPHLLCDRLHPDKILAKMEKPSDVVAYFNDIATTRSACLQGLGWALLPTYAIKDELSRHQLVQIDDTEFGNAKYGVWWLRHRTYMQDTIEKLITWLKGQEL